ncbi:hypothetical protein [Leisingera sp.]|uniref:hypothetical protein n=1 Tax=Leisingera sp. TaxID=1879318 RepID=UPI002B268BFE|nr:hypothetical protein [Leisingera sp.]
MDMQNTAFKASAPILSDQEFEAQALRDLAAARKAECEREKASVVRFQYPDNRTDFSGCARW